METNLDDILNDKEPEVEEQQPEAEVSTEAEARARDENGRFAKQETEVKEEQEEPAEPGPSPELSVEERGQMAALKAERAKRQQLEAELERMQQHFRQQAPQQGQKPDFWDDPDAYLEQRFQQLAPTLMQQMEQQQTIRKVDQSEQAFRAEHPDFDEKLAVFQQQATPQLIQQMAASENPAQFAYERGRTALELQSVGSIDALKQQIRAELEAELKAQVPQPRLPTSTAQDASVGTRKGPEWSGPTSLESILNS
ncbi:hypothetical protein WJS89_10550 [Sphingomicrobium sp. XHP0235]|uniref:hypothetical protein n=1 Tax=Sphingomicrobium aquimarinum TaxID=3133971 RepID=UPI0031FE96FA